MIIKTRYRKDRKPKIYCNGICFAVDRQGEEHVCREFDRYESESEGVNLLDVTHIAYLNEPLE